MDRHEEDAARLAEEAIKAAAGARRRIRVEVGIEISEAIWQAHQHTLIATAVKDLQLDRDGRRTVDAVAEEVVSLGIVMASLDLLKAKLAVAFAQWHSMFDSPVGDNEIRMLPSPDWEVRFTMRESGG